jgi:hypothetical protein
MPLLPSLFLLQDPFATSAPEGNPIAAFLLVGFLIFLIASMWIVFAKAGEYGWACLIPIYCWMVMARVGNKPGWWGLLMCIPVIGIIVWFVIAIGVAERFGRSSLFGFGIALLPFIFLPLLAFGDNDASQQMA